MSIYPLIYAGAAQAASVILNEAMCAPYTFRFEPAISSWNTPHLQLHYVMRGGHFDPHPGLTAEAGRLMMLVLEQFKEECAGWSKHLEETYGREYPFNEQ